MEITIDISEKTMTAPNSTPTRTVQISYYETILHTATIEVPVGPDQDIWDAAHDHLCENPVQTATESLGMDDDSLDVQPLDGEPRLGTGSL